jgi:uncharacterized protein (TIGR02266 family)
MSSDDKRKAGQDREPLALVVEYEGAEDLYRDYTQNLSSGGTFIQTDRELSVGDKVDLQLSFPRLLAPLSISGVVRWVRPLSEEDSGAGIEFVDFEKGVQDDLERVLRLIQERDPDYVDAGLRVLLVEDNPHVARLIRDGLGSGRYSDAAVECVGATNGRQALDLLYSENFDVLVIDVNLPVIDGPTVIATLRQEEPYKTLPVIAVSAGGEEAREWAMTAGADFFLAKPMRLREIFATMHLLLDGRNS